MADADRRANDTCKVDGMGLDRHKISKFIAVAGLVIVVSNNVNQFFGSIMNGDTYIILAIILVVFGALIDVNLLGKLR
jgi:hypothetical protein